MPGLTMNLSCSSKLDGLIYSQWLSQGTTLLFLTAKNDQNSYYNPIAHKLQPKYY